MRGGVLIRGITPVIIPVLLLCGCKEPQAGAYMPVEIPGTFISYIGGNEGDAGYSVVETDGGEYVVAGASSQFLWVGKLDSAGSLVWERTYGYAGTSKAYSIDLTSDGGFVLAGVNQSSVDLDDTGWLLKLDSQGDDIWDHSYGGSESDRYYSTEQTSDGGYIVCGTTFSFGAGSSDAWLIRYGVDGSIIWTETYGSSADDHGRYAVETSDGGFILAGYTVTYSPASGSIWLMKVDAGGRLLWQHAIEGSKDDRGYSVVEAEDGGFLVTGSTTALGSGDADVFLMKVNASGNREWYRTYGGELNDEGRFVIRRTSGGYAVIGSLGISSALNHDMWLIVTDLSGNILVSKSFDSGYDDYGYCVRETDDGGFILVGTASTGPGSTSFTDIFIVKADSQGAVSSI